MNHTSIPTPAGILSVVVDRTGLVTAAGFGDADRLAGPAGPGPWLPDLGGVSKAILAYLDGDLSAIDGVAVREPAVGEFATGAWRALRSIPPGQPWTYRRLATAAGRPTAVRAAASACARNPVGLLIPCHRVVRAGGGLGGYRWGLDVKRWLLDHERRVTGRTPG